MGSLILMYFVLSLQAGPILLNGQPQSIVALQPLGLQSAGDDLVSMSRCTKLDAVSMSKLDASCDSVCAGQKRRGL